jgi:hypothetical protein
MIFQQFLIFTDSAEEEFKNKFHVPIAFTLPLAGGSDAVAAGEGWFAPLLA